jgi:hypothetical protein
LTIDQWQEVARDQGFQAVKAYRKTREAIRDGLRIIAQQAEIPAILFGNLILMIGTMRIWNY